MTFEEWYYREHGCVPDSLDRDQGVAELATAFEAGQQSAVVELSVRRNKNLVDYRTRLLHEYCGRAMQGLLAGGESVYVEENARQRAITLITMLEEEGLL